MKQFGSQVKSERGKHYLKLISQDVKQDELEKDCDTYYGVKDPFKRHQAYIKHRKALASLEVLVGSIKDSSSLMIHEKALILKVAKRGVASLKFSVTHGSLLVSRSVDQIVQKHQ